MSDYDVKEAFYRIEMELLESMIRNMKNHRAEEIKEGFEWTQWQSLQMKGLEEYKRRNRQKFKPEFRDINQKIRMTILRANAIGKMAQEAGILRAIREGFSLYKKSNDAMTGAFFRMNDRKMEALVEATLRDMAKAETAILRMANDQYRKVIFDAQVYANSRSGTYEKAVDMATKDMLAAGLNCIKYSNGSRHTLESYAEMALRTAGKRAYLQGEGTMRKAWGVHTVIINKRGDHPCPLCLPWVGRVLVDDVWSGGNAEEARAGPFPLMSQAVDAGLYHPSCRDVHTTYFEGVSDPPDRGWTKQELEEIKQNTQEEAKQQYAKRQQQKFDRLAKFSLDADNRKKYAAKAAEWKGRAGRGPKQSRMEKAYQSFLDGLQHNRKKSLHRDKMLLYSEYTELCRDKGLTAPFAYVEKEDVIKYNPKYPNISLYDLDYVFAHELTHRMDCLEYHSWENERFVSAVENCSEKVYAQKDEIQKWFEAGGKHEKSFALSDIIDALSNGDIEVPVGHNEGYYKADARRRFMEIFANISSIDVLGLDEHEDILQELFTAYGEMVR